MATVPFYKDPDFLRPQAAYLLLAIVLLAGSLWLPVYDVQAPEAAPAEHPLQEVTSVRPLDAVPLDAQPPEALPAGSLALLFGLGAVFPLSALLGYRQRKKALRLARFGAGYCLLVLFALLLLLAINSWLGVAIGQAGLLLCALLHVLAARGIRQDIRRVRSAERFW